MSFFGSLPAAGAPAAGAPVGDLVSAGIVGTVLVALVAVFGAMHRANRTTLLTRAGAAAERNLGLPGWAALPLMMAQISLLVAVFGFYWDVATHIDAGRDPGPFANASHFYIIAGLAGIALAGVASILLGRDAGHPSVRIRDGWHAPVGGVLLFVCGQIAVLGFPLDDVWHRLFGQDVTLWSPTHVQMVGGASLSTLALWMLVVEGKRAAPAEPRSGRLAFLTNEALVAGSFLMGLSALQAEFDYSVPQFRLLYHPILLMGSAGIALVAARLRVGRGGALKALVLFLVLRGLLSVVVGPVIGHTTLHFPLYLGEALAVEAVGLRLSTDRQLRFGAVAGVALATLGLASEWAWSHVWMTIPWPASLLPEGVIFGFVAGVAGGVTGGYIGRALSEPGRPREHASRLVAAATALGIVVVLVYPFVTTTVDGSATVTLEPVSGKRVEPRVSVHPRSLADDAEWFTVTSWQGGGSVVEPLEPAGRGTYTAPDPIPVGGEWKSLIRLQTGSSISATPIYLPKDPAIPAPEVPAKDRFTRPFVLDKRIVLREAKEVSPALTYGASGALLLIVAFWIASLGWGLHRLESAEGRPQRRLTPAVAAH